jgi:hypothetical protein
MATIYSLRRALESPLTHFATLRELRLSDGNIFCSALFAEARILLRGSEYLLLMPLSPISLRYVERFRALSLHLTTDIVPELQVLRDEMSYESSYGDIRRCDVLLEPLPHALPYSDAVAMAAEDRHYAEVLCDKLHHLDELFREYNISHRNLRKENLMIDGEHNIRPIRWYYATRGYGEDSNAFKLLREQIATSSAEGLYLAEECGTYHCSSPATAYLPYRRMSEGLIAFERNAMWGFVDECGVVVIEPQFTWVNDFYEGRAEVMTDCGMGLIDRRGNFVIPPRYQIVEFDHHSGCSNVLTEGEWICIDYSGNKIEKQ